MADIAMLVAEEYERRIKHSREIGGSGCGGAAEEEERIGYVSSVSMRLKKVGSEENMEMVKWVLEPKSQIGLAAINGFFSA